MSKDESSPSSERSIPFGAGLKRKHVQFVAAEEPKSAQDTVSVVPSTSAGDRYLSIVLKKNGSTSANTTGAQADGTLVSLAPSNGTSDDNSPVLCEICKLPIESAASKPHEASIAHMVCLNHSHPPSHLDRDRQGLKYLASYGWDPDSRMGLGAAGEGIRAPIKVKPKHDTVGIGVDLEKIKRTPEKRHMLLNAKQARKKYIEDRRKGEKLQEMFYRDDDVERYLGSGS